MPHGQTTMGSFKCFPGEKLDQTTLVLFCAKLVVNSHLLDPLGLKLLVVALDSSVQKPSYRGFVLTSRPVIAN